MAIRNYVGARYVPKFADPVEWQANTSYEAMVIVTYNNSSYTSKIPVPPTVGNPAENPMYWALTGNYNAQVEAYREETAAVQEELTQTKDDLAAVQEELTQTKDELANETQEMGKNISDIKKIGTDLYSPTSTIIDTITFNLHAGHVQGATIVNGTGYVAYNTEGDSVLCVYPDILNGNVSPSKTITIPNCAHPNSINYYNGYLYINDSMSGHVHVINANTLESFKECVTSSKITNTVLINYADKIYRIGEDINQDALYSIMVNIGDNGVISESNLEKFIGSVPTNNHHNYTQGICAMPDGYVCLIRSYTSVNQHSYLMFVNPKNNAMRFIVAIPYETEAEDVCVYLNNLYVFNANGTIYNIGPTEQYTLQFASDLATSVSGQYTNGMHFYYYKNLQSNTFPIRLSFKATDGMLRFNTFTQLPLISLKLIYDDPSNIHDPVSITFNPLYGTDTIVTGIQNRRNEVVIIQLNLNAFSSNEYIINFQGVIAGTTHYTDYNTLPESYKPNRISLYINE